MYPVPPGFRGNLEHTVSFERQLGVGKDRVLGQPYVRDRVHSGINLDVGYDTSLDSPHTIERVFGSWLDDQELGALLRSRFLTGERAQAYLQNDHILLDIRIPERCAIEAFAEAAVPYWEQVIKRWPEILGPDTPGALHTALLDVVYCRGIINRYLRPLDYPVRKGQYSEVVSILKDMQSRTSLTEVKGRRAFFAKLLKEEIAEVDETSEEVSVTSGAENSPATATDALAA